MGSRIQGRRRNKIMELYHKKVILEFMGLEPNEVPKQVSQIDLLLEAAKRENPERYKVAYDIVVNKNAVQPDAPQEQIDLANLTEILDEKIGEYEGKAIQAVSDNALIEQQRIGALFSASAVEVKKAAMDAALAGIEEASKKFIRNEYIVVDSKGKENKVDGPLPECFQDVLDLAAMRMNILLVGPSGCGKTHLGLQLSAALGLDFASQSCSAGMSESIFAGWLLPVEGNGQFVYVSSEFVRIYENGGIFLFDEIDASDSNTLLFLNQALANGYFYLPQRHQKPKVTKHKNFIAVAAANTMGSGATSLYNGRNALDAASMDRFRMGVIAMDYSPTVEEALVDPDILKWGRIVREMIRKRNLRKIMSTRLMLDATKMKKDAKWTLHKIANSYLADWSPEERKMLEMTSEYISIISKGN